MQKREKQFLIEMTPILTMLNSHWFEPGKKSPEGYNYACTYCDMGCSTHISHDEDCLFDRAKRVLEKLQEVDNDPKYLKDWKGQDRALSDVVEIRDGEKLRQILKIMFNGSLNMLIPLDYADPVNEGVVCECSVFSEKREHNQDCPRINMSKALSRLLSPV